MGNHCSCCTPINTQEDFRSRIFTENEIRLIVRIQAAMRMKLAKLRAEEKRLQIGKSSVARHEVGHLKILLSCV